MLNTILFLIFLVVSFLFVQGKINKQIKAKKLKQKSKIIRKYDPQNHYSNIYKNIDNSLKKNVTQK